MKNLLKLPFLTSFLVIYILAAIAFYVYVFVKTEPVGIFMATLAFFIYLIITFPFAQAIAYFLKKLDFRRLEKKLYKEFSKKQ